MAQRDGMEAVAADLAVMMWIAEHGRNPRVADANAFLDLLRRCRAALNGTGGWKE